MRPLLLLALVTLPLAGCLDSVLPDVVLPKTLDLELRYEAGAQPFEGLTYDVVVTDPDGEVILDEAGQLAPGAGIDVLVTFETVGPYTVALDLASPNGESWSKEVTWDFRIICRDVDELRVTAILSDDGLDWDVDDTGSIVCL